MVRKSGKPGGGGTPMRALGTAATAQGIEAAELIGDGRRLIELGEIRRRPFDGAERAMIRAAEGQFTCAPELAAMIEDAHAELLAGFARPDAIGFSGLMLAHDPEGRRSHQAGNGAILAEALGAPVIWDLRSADLRAGGQGSPIGAFYYHALARHLGLEAPALFIRIDDVAQMMLADPARPEPQDPGALIAFDAGPGLPAEAGPASGEATEEGALEALLSAPFFARIPPRALPRPHGMALPAPWRVSLAGVIAAAADHLPHLPRQVVIGGAGSADAELVALIGAGLGRDVATAESLGLEGDGWGAQAAAHLALRLMGGMPACAPATTGVPAPLGGAQISRPSGRF